MWNVLFIPHFAIFLTDCPKSNSLQSPVFGKVSIQFG